MQNDATPSKEQPSNRDILLSMPTYVIRRYLKGNCIIEEHENTKDENLCNYFTFIDIIMENGITDRRSLHIPGARNIEEAYLKAQKYIDIEKARLEEKFSKPDIVGPDGSKINKG